MLGIEAIRLVVQVDAAERRDRADVTETGVVARRRRVPLSVSRHPDDGAYDAEITHLYVRTEARGAGLGRRLMAAVAGALLPQGKDCAVVRVFKGNPYEGFYRRLAGRHTVERPLTLEGHRTAEKIYVWDDLCRLTLTN